MYKIFLIGSHLGYNLEHYVKMALERLGHSVKFFGYRNMLGSSASLVRMAITRSATMRTLAKPIFLNRIDKKLRREGNEVEADLVLSIKGEAVPHQTVEWFREKLGVKTVLWYPDDPLFFNSLVKHIAPHYEYIFTASEKAVQMYREKGIKNVGYLTFACEPSVHKRVRLTSEEEKRFNCDVCFVGTYYPRRSGIISKLDKFDISVYGPHWNLFKRKGKISSEIWGHEMVKAFNASKIVLNIHIKTDLAFKPNMRTFEATGSGSFLLTDRPYGLDRLFKLGEELICYNDEEELPELVKYYLQAEEERIKIGVRGQKRSYEEHTYTERMSSMLKQIKL